MADLIMNNIKEKNKEYTAFARFIFAVFGFGWLIGFVYELYQYIYGDRISVMIILTLGALSYLFLYTAYKGKAPAWFEDKSFFNSTENKDSDY